MASAARRRKMEPLEIAASESEMEGSFLHNNEDDEDEDDDDDDDDDDEEEGTMMPLRVKNGAADKEDLDRFVIDDDDDDEDDEDEEDEDGMVLLRSASSSLSKTKKNKNNNKKKKTAKTRTSSDSLGKMADADDDNDSNDNDDDDDDNYQEASPLNFAVLVLTTSATLSFCVTSLPPFWLVSKVILHDVFFGQWYPSLVFSIERIVVGIVTLLVLGRTVSTVVTVRRLMWCPPRRRQGRRGQGGCCRGKQQRQALAQDEDNDEKEEESSSLLHLLLLLWVYGIAAALHGLALPYVYRSFHRGPIFREADDTLHLDWIDMDQNVMFPIVLVGFVSAALEGLVLLTGLWILVAAACCPAKKAQTTTTTNMTLSVRQQRQQQRQELQQRRRLGCIGRSWDQFRTHARVTRRILVAYQVWVWMVLLALVAFFVASCLSAYTYLGPAGSSTLADEEEACDGLDTTACYLPFPSNFYTVEDSTTVTGRRVALSTATLRTIYRGKNHYITTENFSYLSQLDGFSTSGPILFSVPGLEKATTTTMSGSPSLMGPTDVAQSITPSSMTLLVDVEQQSLVPHFCEWQEEDATLVLQPARPLRHNATHAVVVAGAVGADGKELPPAPGLTQLLAISNLMTIKLAGASAASRRAHHFRTHLLPAIQQAAPWVRVDFTTPESALQGNGGGGGGGGDSNFVNQDKVTAAVTLQVLFDFTTASAESQLGPGRQVRNAMMQQITSFDWPPWKNLVRVTRLQDDHEQCDDANAQHYLARTIHAEVTLPWFLKPLKKKKRNAPASWVLNLQDMEQVLQQGGKSIHRMRRQVKVIVMIPCSLVQKDNPKELRAIVDYGHTLLGSRGELLTTRYLHRLANENGWILMASDWRGMSVHEVPLVNRMLTSDPNLVSAFRDTLLHGYAERGALQHFARNGLLGMDFMKIPGRRPIRLSITDPRLVFYGLSQGGSLGSGYSTLMGGATTTHEDEDQQHYRPLLDGAFLGGAGSPMALVATRSHVFIKYRAMMQLLAKKELLALILIQMAVDSVEGGGTLAPPLTEPHPPTLMHAGLGDAFVTTLATAFLARGYQAVLLPHAVQPIYGLSQVSLEEGQDEREENAAAQGGGDFLDSRSNWTLSMGPFDPQVVEEEAAAAAPPSAILTELLFQRGVEALPKTNEIPAFNGVHYCVWQDAYLQQQLTHFVNHGVVNDPCMDDAQHCVREFAAC